MRRVGVMPFMVGGWSPFDELSTLRRDSQKTSATGCVPHMRISAWLVPAWAGQFAAHLKELGLRASMGKVGQCWDNAMAESFFVTNSRSGPLR